MQSISYNYVDISRKTNDKDPTVFNINLLKHESFDNLHIELNLFYVNSQRDKCLQIA